MGRHKHIRDTGILNTDKNRFYANILINDNSECIEWKGTMKSNGYGQFKTLNKKWFHAHRYSYELFIGKITKNMCVLHQCDNRKCVNPNHLWLGTKKDNTQDMINKNRKIILPLKGEMNGMSKLKEHDIKTIRSSYSIKNNCTELSKIYRVSISTIDRIVRNITWRNI